MTLSEEKFSRMPQAFSDVTWEFTWDLIKIYISSKNIYLYIFESCGSVPYS